MSKHVTDLLETGKARVVDAPVTKEIEARSTPRHQVESDRRFELPTALYAVTVGSYLGFLALMLAAFAAPGLVIPMAIFALFIVAAFGVPAVWTRLKDNVSKPLTMGQFGRDGIMTHTGRLSASEASAQMLILPVLILLWGCAVVTIAALV